MFSILSADIEIFFYLFTRIGTVVLPKRIEFNIISEQVLAIELIVMLLNMALFSLSHE